MHIMSPNLARTLVWEHENDVKVWRHKQCTPNDHHMTLNQNPPWKLSAYATARGCLTFHESIMLYIPVTVKAALMDYRFMGQAGYCNRAAALALAAADKWRVFHYKFSTYKSSYGCHLQQVGAWQHHELQRVCGRSSDDLEQWLD